MCVDQCKHWSTPLFLFAIPAGEKKCKQIPNPPPHWYTGNDTTAWVLLNVLISSGIRDRRVQSLHFLSRMIIHFVDFGADAKLICALLFNLLTNQNHSKVLVKWSIPSRANVKKSFPCEAPSPGKFIFALFPPDRSVFCAIVSYANSPFAEVRSRRFTALLPAFFSFL